MDEHQDAGASPGGRRGRRFLGIVAGVVATGLAVGITLTSLGVAGAQTSTPSAAPSTGAAPMPGAKFGHGFRHGGFGFGAIHGEFTTAAPGGGYQTLATQIGEVTSVSASSITVKSEDGFSRTYGVDDNTLVNAGNEGIDDVKTGDTVRITAVVDGSRARAVEVFDGTNVQQLGDKWRPLRPAPPATTS